MEMEGFCKDMELMQKFLSTLHMAQKINILSISYHNIELIHKFLSTLRTPQKINILSINIPLFHTTFEI